VGDRGNKGEVEMGRLEGFERGCGKRWVRGHLFSITSAAMV